MQKFQFDRNEIGEWIYIDNRLSNSQSILHELIRHDASEQYETMFEMIMDRFDDSLNYQMDLYKDYD